jgi:hypothetical protein
MLDCPTGTGKTLAGVALSLLDYRQNPEASIGGSPVAVVHLIWPKAVSVQPIYSAIVKQTGVNHLFFKQASDFKYWLLKSIRDEAEKAQYVRENLLHGLFPGMNIEQMSKTSLLVIIDEVPEDPMDVQCIAEIRDALKLVKNLCLIMSGTHSKASNMIGLSQGMTTVGNNYAPSLWAMIVTRLPRFIVKSSFVAEEWEEMNQSQFTWLLPVLDAIKCSISNGGNPLLIVFAIQTAYKVFVMHKQRHAMLSSVRSNKKQLDADVFYSWQKAFSFEVLQYKFNKPSFAMSSKGLLGQLNLLLEAAAPADLSDVLLGHHFAVRAIPDNAGTASCKKDADFSDCGGCLYLARQRDRAVGQSTFFVRGLPREDAEDFAFFSWQTTCFSPANVDILLYLMACRENGYLTVSVTGSSCNFRAHEVVLPLLSSYTAGFVNFQNSRSFNPGSMLEVLICAAVSNAAGRASKTHGFTSFMLELGKELGVGQDSSYDKFSNDYILSKLCVPKFIFPGQNLLLSNNRYFGNLKGLLGTAEKQANVESFYLMVQTIGSDLPDAIRFEVNDQVKFGTVLLVDAARKLLMGDSNVGVLILRKCNSYWGSGEKNIENREALAKNLRVIPKLGKAYLISSTGYSETLVIRPGIRATGRMIVMQVPESSLSETL